MPAAGDWLWTAVAALQLGGALAVTAHVLLRRRPPVSAAAWIGLAWLAPVSAGVLLYLALGINRIERRGRGLRRRHLPAPDEPACCAIAPPQLIPLGRAAARITGRPLLAGNAVAPLLHGDAAYPAMLAAIGGARRSVALSSYIFRDDAVGRAFVAALAAARERGVAVRVLIDGVGGGYFRAAALGRLRAAGVPAARFLHTRLPWRMPILNLRLHKKLLIVDGRVGFAGGLNIGAEYRDAGAPGMAPRRPVLARRRRAIRDTHFRIEGPVVGQMMAAFAEDWVFAAGETLEGDTWFAPAAVAGGALARVVVSGPDHTLEHIKLLMMSAIAAARRRVRIVTPYFLPDDALASALALAALRGVAVEILVGARTDHRLVDWAMRDGLLAMAQAGCAVQWGEAPFDHSKLMTVDGAWSLIGSANWDMRSLRLNFELVVEVTDAATAAAVDARIDAMARRAASVAALRDRGTATRLRDAAARLLLPYL